MKLKTLIRLAVVAVIFAGPGLLAAAGQPPVARIRSVHPDHVYAGDYDSLERVDFRDLDYAFFVADDGPPYQAIQLADGAYESEDEYASEAVDLVAVHLLPGTGGRAEFAIVELQEHTCEVACADWGVVKVFRLDGRRLVEVQELWFEDHDGGSSFDEAARVLRVQATARGDDDEEDLDLATYRWTGAGFELASLETPPAE